MTEQTNGSSYRILNHTVLSISFISFFLCFSVYPQSLTEGAGSYYHLNHSELVALLVQCEAELAKQKVAFEKQKVLLTKRELELKKLKPQVRDLEDYIDTLLVRIMEQKPTLLQVRSKFK